MADFTVDTLADTVDAEDGLTSLREAVAAANAQPGEDSIRIEVSGRIALDPGLGEIAVTETLGLDGQGSVTLDGGGATRLLSATDPEVRLLLAGLTLTGGNGEGAGTGGGALHAAGDVTLDTVEIRGNATFGDDAAGGGLRVGGTLLMLDSTVAENATSGQNAKGGGVWAGGSVFVSGGGITGNTTSGAYAGGGGLHAQGSVLVSLARIADNATAGLSAGGGGLSGASEVTLSRVTVSSNATYGTTSNGGGVYARGALSVEDSTIGGTAPGTGNRSFGSDSVGGGLAGRAEVTLLGTTVAGNTTQGTGANGGGLYALGALTVGASGDRGSLISGNRTEGTDAQGGGGFARGPAVLSDTTIADNATLGARASGGGLHGEGTVSLATASLTGNATQGGEAPGGGLYARGGLTLEAVHAAGNATLGAGAAGGAAATGGGLALSRSTLRENATAGQDAPGGALSVRGMAEIADSALEANTTSGAGSPGGALFVQAGLAIDDATLSDNATEGDASGGGAVWVGGPAAIRASTLAGNRTEGLGAAGGAVAADGRLVLDGATLSGNATLGDGAGGGGAYAAGLLTAHASTVSENRAEGLGVTGGGLKAGGPALLVQTTLAGNVAQGANAAGGGIAGAGALTLINATVTGNRAESGGGGIFSAGPLALGNSLVLGNAGAEGAADVSAPGVEELGPNLTGAGAAPEAVFAATAPLGGEGPRAGLLSAEGRVATVALRADAANPALDAGIAALLSEPESGRDLNGDGDTQDVLATDPRGPGFARAIDLPGIADGAGAAPDLGAMELGTARQPPAARDDRIALSEGAGPATLDPLANDTIPEGATAVLAALDTEGLSGAAEIIGEAGLRYAPPGDLPALSAGESWGESFTYRLETDTGAAATGRVTVEIAGVNDPPLPADDSATVAADTPVEIAVLANDVDPDPGDGLRIAALDTAATLGRARIADDGTSILYDPSPAFADLLEGETAVDSLHYTVADAAGAEAAARLDIAVAGRLAPPAPPEPRDDAVTVAPGASVLIDPRADNGQGPDTDPNGDALAVTALGSPSAGIAGLTPEGRIVYRADRDAAGTDGLDYTVTDATGLTATGRITLEIAPDTPTDGLGTADAQRIAYLFEAAFGRAGAAAGINHWIDRREADGLTHREVATAFVVSEEFEARIGPVDGLAAETVVRGLYQNVLGRDGLEPGIAHWTARLEDPAFTAADLLIAFADSPENVLGAPEVATLAEVSDGVWAFL